MSYPKVKQEDYRLFGGINNKVSTYLNSPMEFLNLENLDFQTPGSLTKSWGSTQYFGNSLSGKIDGLYEFVTTYGQSYQVAAAGGTLGQFRDNSFSAQFSGITATSGWTYLGGQTFWVNGLNGFSSSFALGSSLNLDFVTMQNQMFFCNGKGIFKYAQPPPGQTNTFSPPYYFFGLPTLKYTSGTAIVGATAGNGTGLTGFYYFRFAWINSYGMQGAPNKFEVGFGPFTTPRVFIAAADASVIRLSIYPSAGITSSLRPPGFDYYGAYTGASPGLYNSMAAFWAGPYAATLTPEQINDQQFNYLGQLNEYSGVTFGYSATFFAAQFNGLTTMNPNVLGWDWWKYDASSVLSASPFMLQDNVGPNSSMPVPTFLETYANRLFMGGFTNILSTTNLSSNINASTIWYSEVNEPEHLEADFSQTINAQDGQPITAMKSYNGFLVVFKENSFYVMSGDSNPFQVTQVSSDYGCLGNRAVTTYNNMLVFLDRKGLVLYNGANINILSTKIDPIFARMNLSACRENACVTFDKQRNEILCDIPVDGSTQANLTVVYDIINNCFTTYKGVRPSVSAVMKAGLPKYTVFYGGYSGLVSYYGQSFLLHNGVGYTCVAKSGFLIPMGKSITKSFRRLYLDTDPVGPTSAIDVNLYQDFGSSIVISRTMYQEPFQSIINYGIQGKSMSAEFIMGSTFSLQMHGFSIDYRFQRNT